MARALVVALVTLSACTGTDPAALPSDGPQKSRPAEVPIPDGMKSLPWRLDAVDGSMVHVTVMNGGCDRPERLIAAEGSAVVHIVALAPDVAATSSEPVACTSDLRFEPMSVDLDAPVGERSLVHEPIDPGWDDHPDATDEWRGVERAPHPSD